MSIAKRIEDLEDLEKKKKSDTQIIEYLIDDTEKNKFHWYGDEDTGIIYSRLRREVETKYGKTQIDIIFRIYEQEIEEEFDEYDSLYYSAEYQGILKENILCLDILMTKNGKKEILCRRINGFQYKLRDLLNVILKILKPKPKKKNG